MAFTRACNFSYSVSLAVVVPKDSAYFLYTVSNRIIIPISSRISGSAFTIPRVKRSIESVKSLPNATDAARATSAILTIVLLVRPEVAPRAAAVDACLKPIIYPVASWIFLAILPMFLPVNLAYCVWPSTSTR